MNLIPSHDRTFGRAAYAGRFFHVLLLIGGLFAAAALPARAQGPTNEGRALAVRLDQILNGHNDPKAKLAARVVDLTTGEVLFEHAAETPLIPASNMKLMVITAAVDAFGPDHKLKTVLSIRGRDLVVVGGGDPAFGDEKLCASRGEPITAVFRAWAEKLAAAGVKQVSGDLVIDDSLFDATYVHSNWPADQFQAWYEAPIGALNFNANCADVTLSPAAPGKPAVARLVPGNVLLQLVNQTTSGGKHGPSLRRKRGTDSLVVAGPVAKNCKLGPVTVRDPGLYFGHVFKTVLASKGIRVAGKVVRESVKAGPDGVPDGGHVVAVHAAPITDATIRAGRDSLGMMAEGLLKLLGSHESGRGTWATGRAAMAKFFARAGVSEGQFVVDDGSGLSRANRLSVKAVTQVLAYAHKLPGGKFQAIRDSLARPGREGTLKRRMRDAPVRDRVHAKTGYINGVRTLAGFVEASNGHMLAFAFFYNGTGKTRPLATLQDKACAAMAAWPGSPASAAAR